MLFSRMLALFLCLMPAANAADKGTDANAKKTPAKPDATPVPATLYWNNGESITGEPVEATARTLTWKTPLFDGPLVLEWAALRRIDRTLPSVSGTDSFGIRLRDGSFIQGDLVSVAEKSVTIHSALHGEVVLKRSDLLSVQRIRGGDLVYSGPTGDVGWKPQSENVNYGRNESGPEFPPLVSGPGGALLMPYWNRGAVLNLDVPDRVEIEFRMRFSARPDFRMTLAAGQKQALSVETWDEDLVLTVSNQFKAIRKIAADEREVGLHLFWDRKAGKCSVFTPEGELISEWQVPAAGNDGTKYLTLQNKGRDLSLESLRVRAWNGKPPLKINVKQPYIELTDGRIIEGEAESDPEAALKVRASGKGTGFAIKDVDTIIFSTNPPQVEGREATLSFSDGTMVMGRVSSMKDGSAAIETSFTKTPLPSRIESLRQWRIRVKPAADTPPEPPLSGQDKIVIGQTTLHGKLVCSDEEWARWLPSGGVTPVIPSRTQGAEITRTFPADAVFQTPSALFYTSAGDVLPGKLRSIDRSGVEFESALMELAKLPAGDLDAIQLGAMARMNLKGFDEPGWHILKGDEKTVRREKDTLNLEPGTAIGHPAVMLSNEVKFTCESNSAFRLRLFCAGTDGAKSINLVLWNMGGRFFYGMESSEGQLENQFQTMVQSNQVMVRLVIQEKQVDLYFDNVQAQSFPVPPEKREGAGLVIEPAGLWGNSVNAVVISGFSTVSGLGCAPPPIVSPETRIQALTVPRFRKDDPPRHLLIAANGDVLRGEIEAATARYLAFRSGLENLRVPIERVRAVVWLRQPKEKTPEENTAGEEENQNGTGTPYKGHVSRRQAENALNDLRLLDAAIDQYTIEHNAANGIKLKFADLLPYFKKGSRITFNRDPLGNSYGDGFITGKLPTVCAATWNAFASVTNAEFWKPYQLPQEINVPPPGLVKKIYWLKADAFPGNPTAMEILVDKGISFPQGAAVFWNPGSRQLSLTNTPENHVKLAQVLASDFGGVLDSPTHWLLLASGARFGLAVDKFGKDSITGHHPVYGRLNVPLSEIHVIRTSRPETNTTMKALADWRLVNAPEPALPESGGESSPSLGKEARTFKLPLLGGGEFDLGHEKGKVVVIDFWATWCGPCIRSLPGLIESMSTFPSDRVKFIGVNQAEPPGQVKRFLETRAWKIAVALDAGQSVARQYGVDSIPHTVVVGQDGKVALVKTGYSPDGAKQIAEAVNHLLASPPAPTAP